MQELELQQIETINGSGVVKDMAWSTLVSGAKGAA